MEFVFLLAGLVIGGAAAWLAARSRIARLETEAEHARRSSLERESLRGELETSLKALSSDLQRDTREDLERQRRELETSIAPLRESLDRYDKGVHELEKARSETYGALRNQLTVLADTQERLRSETANLVTALRAPAVRGRWGEIQLRRVVEAAGMLPYCDFIEQASSVLDGRTLRPDLIVRLPGAKQVVVDAKTPLAAYLAALEATDEDVRAERLRDHARQVREHVAKLSAKAYWQQFESSPDFVVLFIPGDPFFAAALDQDPGLQEDAWRQRIVLATPSTLIGLLFVVAYGWRQEKVAENARRVGELGKQLFERLGVLASHFAKVRSGLDTAVRAYNDAVGSLERSVLPSARRFPDLGVAAVKELPELEPVQQATRVAQAPELALPHSSRDAPDEGVPDAA
jgi:DNA recombination protein RmuC